MSLIDVEETMQDFLLDYEVDMESYVTDETQEGLKVYADSYWLRLHDILSKQFPTLKAYVGEREFAEWAYDYFAEFPSQYASIHQVGGLFPDFIANQFETRKDCQQLAQFEWQLFIATYCPPVRLLDLTVLQKIPAECWAKTHFKLHPAVAVLHLNYDVASCWQRATQAEFKTVPELVAADNIQLIWYQAPNSMFAALDDLQAELISQIQQGESFGEICEHFVGRFADDAELAQWLMQNIATWAQSGLLIQ